MNEPLLAAQLEVPLSEKDIAEVRDVVRIVLSLDGPVVCDVMVSPNEQTLPRVTSSINPDGQIVSRPMEDMSPLLDRAEFLQNLMIPPVDAD